MNTKKFSTTPSPSNCNAISNLHVTDSIGFGNHEKRNYVEFVQIRTIIVKDGS